MHKRRIIIPIILVVAVSLAVYWYLTTQKDVPAEEALMGSGTVEAITVTISPEVFGRIADVAVKEGEQVEPGDRLFELDSTLLSAQLNQARVNLEAAKAGMQVARESAAAAQSGVEIAQAQYELALAQALQQAQPARVSAWMQDAPPEFDQPAWYYTQAEQVVAADEELRVAKTALEAERANLEAMKSSRSYAGLAEAETRLALARAAFLNAEDVLNRAELQGNDSLIDSAQEVYDTANDELDAAQSAYDDLLSTQEAQDILDARARLAVVQERYDSAQDRYNAFLTGRDSPQVRVAEAAKTQAQANASLADSKIRQAQLGIDQAQAALDLITAQMEKLVISSPVAGVVLARNVEPGEVVQPGSSALTLGDLSDLSITVYIPEDRYGQVKLGDPVSVTVDSFPERTFNAVVTRIADQLEFTPRNVQTVEGRSSTVYAIELAVEDPGGLLKPGMPADVSFDQP